jgi:putative membrane protein
MKQIPQTILTVAAVALLCGASAIAQNPGGMAPSQQPPQTTPSQPGMSPLDQANTNQQLNENQQMMEKDFVRNALEGGITEVELGKIAVKNSNNDDVKQFGQKMVDDHSKLNDQMKQVAHQMNVKIPTAPSGKDRATINRLQALNGDDFDKAYIKDMLKDHQQDKKEFKHEAESATNPTLKDVATQGEQIISDHLQMIEQIAEKNNVVASK